MRSREQDQRGYRTVSGHVTGAGVIQSGTGDFSVIRNQAGSYTIRFHKPFRGRPEAVAANANGNTLVAQTHSHAAFSFGVYVSTSGAALTDADFGFIVRGRD